MKAPKRTLVIALISAITLPLLYSSSASAMDRRSFNYWEQSGYMRNAVKHYGKRYVSCHHKVYRHVYYTKPVVAACTTSQTLQPLPTYVCCKLSGKHGVAWRNNWVSGSCRAANPYAVQSSGCGFNSPVYGTGAPILQRGQCQFTSRTSMLDSLHGYYYYK